MRLLKKTTAVLMAVAVSLCFFAVSCDTKPAGDSSSETESVQQYVTGTETGNTDGTAPALEYELNATNAKLIGRSSTAKGGHTFSYGASGFSVRFTGTEFWMYVPVVPMESETAVRKVTVAVLVDTEYAMDAKMVDITGTGWIKVAEGLSEGEHEIEIRKRDRGFYGAMQSDWFNVSKYGTASGSIVKTAAPTPELIIEVYGDSISNGDAVWKNEDGSNSGYSLGNYNGVLERLLDAEVRVSANTGNGLLGWVFAQPNGQADNLFPPQKSWDKFDPWSGIDEDYTRGPDEQTDVVIINLGTNDRGDYRNGDITKQSFHDEYLRFVKQIKTDCPGAIVICTIGAMGGMPEFGDVLPWIARDANAWKGETFCYFLEIQDCGTITGGKGYDNSHPSNLAHEIYGLQFATLINKALGLNKDLPTDVPASAYSGTVEGNIMNAVTKKDDNLTRVQDAFELKNLQ